MRQRPTGSQSVNSWTAAIVPTTVPVTIETSFVDVDDIILILLQGLVAFGYRPERAVKTWNVVSLARSLCACLLLLAVVVVVRFSPRLFVWLLPGFALAELCTKQARPSAIGAFDR